MSTDKVRQAQVKRLEVQFRKPENKECFDCTSKQPRWASTNLGIFFCLNCSGVHRSLGTHITKVKSTTMDTWDESMMQCVERIGNERGKLLYEANGWPGGKLDVNCSGQERERNCRRKYEQKMYYAKNFDELYEQFINTPGGATPTAVMSPAASLSPAFGSPASAGLRTPIAVPTAVKPVETPPVHNATNSLEWGEFGTASNSNGSPASATTKPTSSGFNNLFDPKPTPQPTAAASSDFGVFQTATPTASPPPPPAPTSNGGGADSLMSFKPAQAPAPAPMVEKVQPTNDTNDILAAFGPGAGTGPRMNQMGGPGMHMGGPPPIQPQGNIFAHPVPQHYAQPQQQHQFMQSNQQQHQQRPQPVWGSPQGQSNGGFPF